jgi:hypothetical protein
VGGWMGKKWGEEKEGEKREVLQGGKICFS